MKKIGKLLFGLLLIPAFMLGIKDNAHEVKAEATPVAGTEATLAVSSVIKEAVSSVYGDSMNPEDESYMYTWKNIDRITITNNPDEIMCDYNANPKYHEKDPVEVGESGTKTSVTMRNGSTKEFYVAAYIFVHDIMVNNVKGYDLVLYANVENIYANENSSGLFSGLKTMWSIKPNCFNTERVVDFSNLFADCRTISDFSFLEKFNTPKVKNLSGMFKNCIWLKTMDFNKYPNFRSSEFDSFEDMFYGCEKLESVDMSPLDGSKVTNIRQMFMCCPKLGTIDLSFITSQNIKYCYQAFDCSISKNNAIVSEINISEMGLSNADLTGPNGENELDLGLSKDWALRVVYSPKSLPEGKSIKLPVEFRTYPSLTNENTSLRISCIPDIFEIWWFELRDNNNGNLCEALIPGSLDREDLEYMIEEYDNMDPRDQAAVDARWDVEEENLTIKDSMDYLRDVLNGTQTTDGDYGIKSNNEGNNITLMSLDNTSVSVVIIIAICGIIALASYAIIMRKKYN